MGCGQVADFGHLPAILETPELELVALYDVDLQRAQALSTKYGGRAFSTEKEFFDKNLDVAAITSSAPAHRQNVLDAAKHGVHVLCEKPIAMTDEEGEEMVEAMKAAGKKFYVGFCYRFSPVAEQIRRWIDEGVIGEPKHLRMVYDWNLHGQYIQLPDGTWGESPLYRGRMVEGGPLVDCGVHQIDLARWWSRSEVKSWQASGIWITGYVAPDQTTLQMEHESGLLTTIDVSYSYTHTSREPRSIFTYEVVGTGGVIRYDREGYILEARNGTGVLTAPGASEKNFPGIYRSLVYALSGEPVEMPSAEDGLTATRIARTVTERLVEARAKGGKPFACSA